MITDHRGKTLRCHASTIAHNPAAREWRHRFLLRLGGDDGFYLKVLACLVIVFATGILTRLGFRGSYQRSVLTMAYIVAPLTIASFWVIDRLVRAQRLRTRIDTWLAHALCPACDFDLSKSPPAPDGCTVCPECGAAWRLPPLAEPDASLGA